jgi:tetratricopeptide (TPR) repeat protein
MRFERSVREATQRGLSLLGAGEFFAAHEYFEQAWQGARDAERTLLHALAQLAASYHQLTLGRARAALRTWLKACDKLAAIDALAPDYQHAVADFWARLGVTAEGPRSLPIEDLPARESWPRPEYLRAFVAA